MLGNGLGDAIDTGNLIVLSGQHITGSTASGTSE
ncbi:MAG: hypothetical protein ETSY2_41400 [Candidatus Entotheonella gemina]|uniref:Uncharacterized protein n=1 Tax=Candidatus Entotheonella gemina TaxID=1429439 RepID=W4LM35_9BACT|nr:MAG: hypothetical protein ETSY2_41400 [Candidatus Entotheonella gemina]